MSVPRLTFQEGGIRRYLLRLGIVVFSYYMTGRLGLAIPYHGTHVSLIWAPTGIALAALIRWGLPMWTAVWLGAFLVNLTIGSTPLLAAGIACGNTLGPAVAAVLLRNKGFRTAMDRRLDLLLYVGIAALGGMAINATNGSLNLALSGVLSWSEFPAAWLYWWLGDAVGALIVGVPLLTLSYREVARLGSGWRGAEVLLTLASVVGISLWIFAGSAGPAAHTPLVFLPFLILGWLAVRAGIPAASLGALLLFVIAAWGSAHGQGPFYQEELGLLMLWGYIAALAIVTVLVTVLFAELATSEAHFRSAFDAAALGMAIVSPEGRLIQVNDALCHIVGYPEEQLIRKTLQEITHPDDPTTDLALVNEPTVGVRSGFQLEKRFLHKDGHVVWVQLTGTVVRDRQGEPLHFIAQIQDISARKWAEDALRESREQQQRLLANLPVAVVVHGPDLIIRYCNDAARQFLGLSADQIVGKSGVDPAWRFVREDSAPMPFEEYPVNRVIADGRKLRNYVVGVVHGSGEEPSWALVNAYPDLDPNGKLRHVVVVFIDISEQKRSAEALARSSREIEDLYDNAPCGYHSLDAMGVYIKVNQTELRWLGYERDEILGKCITDIITPASQKTFRENFPRFKQTGSVRDLEFEMIRKDGKFLQVLLNATAIYDEDGRYLTSRSTLFDITSRKQAERRLVELHELNSRIIEESPVGIAAYKASGPCVFANAELARIVGADLEQLRTQDFRRIESWRNSEMLPAALRVLVTGEPWHQEVYVEISLGRKVWLECVFDRFTSGETPHLLFIAHDTSIFHLAMQAAEDASRAKGQFLANMSHEIRTPLSAITGLTELLLDTELTPRQLDYLSKIDLSSQNLLGLVNDILDVSKIEAGQVQLEEVELDLEEVLLNSSSLFAAVAEEKGLEIVYAVAPAVPSRLVGDPLRLGQVVNNLLGNAVKFTERGEIDLEVKAVERSNRSIVLCFTVKDTGMGLSPEQISRLFTPFTQADGSISRQFGGTGLGLTISKQLVVLMGGEIGVESEPGRGSVFWFTVHMKLPERAAPERPYPGLKGDRALVADDLASSRLVLKRMLEAAGMSVETANDGLEAVEVCRNRGPFDLVLLDWKMPGLDGIAAARAIEADSYQQGRLHAPVVVMVTAASHDEAIKAAAGAPIDAVLDKPVTVSRLTGAILASSGGGPLEKRPRHDTDWQRLIGPLRGVRILVVEDYDINRQVVCELLGKADMKVTTATNGEEALDLLEQGEFEIVLMDIQMPVMDGLDATRRIRKIERFHTLPVIAMTAAATREDREAGLRAGMDDYVTKPIQPEHLFTLLRRWLPAREMPPLPLRKWPSESSAPIDLPELPGFALDEVLERVGGNHDFVLRLLRQVHEELLNAKRQLSIFIKQGDNAKAQELIHMIKGVSGNVGALALHRAAEQIDQALREGVRPLEWESFIACLEETTAQLAGLHQPVEQQAPSHTLDVTAVNDALSQLDGIQPLLAERLFVTHGQIEPLKNLLDGSCYMPALQQMLHAIERIDYQGALDALASLRQQLTEGLSQLGH